MGAIHKYSVLVPILNFINSFALFLVLLVIWLAEGHPNYHIRDSSIAFVSDVGAKHEAVFIPLGCVSAVLYVATLVIDYLYRRSERLHPHMRRKYERPIALTSIAFGIAAAIGLILLTIFNDIHHDTLHWTFSLIFFVGVAISGLLKISEFGLLRRDYPLINHIRRSYRAKLVIILFAIALLIAFVILLGICSFEGNAYGDTKCHNKETSAGAIEWTIGFSYVAYLGTLIVDMWPVDEEKLARDIEMGRAQPSKDIEAAPPAKQVDAEPAVGSAMK